MTRLLAPGKRWYQVAKFLLFRAPIIAKKRGSIHSQEGDECAKVEHVKPKTIGEEERPDFSGRFSPGE